MLGTCTSGLGNLKPEVAEWPKEEIILLQSSSSASPDRSMDRTGETEASKSERAQPCLRATASRPTSVRRAGWKHVRVLNITGPEAGYRYRSNGLDLTLSGLSAVPGHMSAECLDKEKNARTAMVMVRNRWASR